MSYYSQVYLKTTTEGWIMMKRFNDSIIEERNKPLGGACVQRTPTGFYKIHFTDVKWHDGYKCVEHFLEMLDRYDKYDIPFSFIRVGEEIDDIEHRIGETDDVPYEIESFEPVVDINDENDSMYEYVSKT